MQRIRKECLELRELNRVLSEKVQAQTNQTKAVSAKAPSATETKRQLSKIDELNCKNREYQQTIIRLQKELKQSEDEAARQRNDVTRLKELSEGYMSEITQLQNAIKNSNIAVETKSRAQRPKDTVKREHSATQSSNAAKEKRVNATALGDVRCLLKLKL